MIYLTVSSISRPVVSQSRLPQTCEEANSQTGIVEKSLHMTSLIHFAWGKTNDQLLYIQVSDPMHDCYIDCTVYIIFMQFLFHASLFSYHCFIYLFFQLKHFRKSYEGYVPMKYRSYMKKMKRLDFYGDACLFFSCKNWKPSLPKI